MNHSDDPSRREGRYDRRELLRKAIAIDAHRTAPYYPLALLLFSQRLTTLGWLGLLMVVGGVAAGYMLEGLKKDPEPA